MHDHLTFFFLSEHGCVRQQVNIKEDDYYDDDNTHNNDNNNNSNDNNDKNNKNLNFLFV